VSSAPPSILARIVQQNIVHLRTDRPDKADAVFAALPDDWWSTVQDASHLAWLPLDVDTQWDKAVYFALGRDDAYAYFRESIRTHLMGPWLAAILRPALALAGRHPAKALKFADVGWQKSYRHNGRLWFETVSDREVMARWIDAPDPNTYMVLATAASLHAIFDILKLDATQRTLPVDDEAPHTRSFRFQW